MEYNEAKKEMISIAKRDGIIPEGAVWCKITSLMATWRSNGVKCSYEWKLNEFNNLFRGPALDAYLSEKIRKDPMLASPIKSIHRNGTVVGQLK
jgi:hypothetical protein